MLLASIILLFSIPITFYLNRLLSKTQEVDRLEQTLPNKPLGGSLYSGFIEFVSNRKLLSIGLFIFIFTGISAFVYFAQKNVLVDFDRDVRAQIWAGLDLAVNVMTFGVGMFLTNRIVRKFGMPFTLSIVPFLVMAGLIVVIGIPSVWMIVGLQFVRKVGNYAITKPSREMLFTAVNQESRFKAKPIIDIVVYRGGDVFWAWGFAILTDQFQFGLEKMALIGAIIAGLWGLIGIYIGKRH
jgi:AAA family ATP:ADP antiporter